MSESRPTGRTLLLLALLAGGLGMVYLSGLDGAGLVGPDEPRYASIGRAMAQSGDWVTPRLWGDAWFEKPPLLYWMQAAGRLAGLNDDLAPRLPVALLSILYLLAHFLLVRRLESERLAWLSTLILASSAGWCAYSQVGVTDLPLAACFSTALLLGLLWMETGSRAALAGAGVAFGLAVLAKGLVPGVLILPWLWAARRRSGALWLPALAAAVVATPWYGWMLALHGRTFFNDFFLLHHLSRFTSNELLHRQPFWFYVPVLAGALFPWPLAVTLLGKSCFSMERRRVLAATFVFGFVFFSLATNKLPGYLLPLLPAASMLLAAGIDTAERAGRQLALCAALLSLCPVVAALLPEALLVGLRRVSWQGLPWGGGSALLALVVVVWLLERMGRRGWAVALLAAAAGSGFLYIKLTAEPALDELVSSRGLWRRVQARQSHTCVEWLNRTYRYGLNYYSVEPLPDCEAEARAIGIDRGAPARPDPDGHPLPAPWAQPGGGALRWGAWRCGPVVSGGCCRRCCCSSRLRWPRSRPSTACARCAPPTSSRPTIRPCRRSTPWARACTGSPAASWPSRCIPRPCWGTRPPCCN